jgi:hypothetical protein
MKLREVPDGSAFFYADNPLGGKFLKLRKHVFLKPRPMAPSLSALAAKFGEGQIFFCNPECDVILDD